MPVLVTDHPYDIGTSIKNVVANRNYRQTAQPIRVTLGVPAKPAARKQHRAICKEVGVVRGNDGVTQIEADYRLQLNTVAIWVEDAARAGEQLAGNLRRLHPPRRTIR